MRRRLTSSTFPPELEASFGEIETWAYQVAQTHLVRCYTPAAATQKVVKHSAGWIPDSIWFSTWDDERCWATLEDRDLWSDTQIAFHATAANVAVDILLVKFGEKEYDVDRNKVNTPTTTGGTSGGGASTSDALGSGTRGKVDTTNGTVRKKSAPKPPSSI